MALIRPTALSLARDQKQWLLYIANAAIGTDPDDTSLLVRFHSRPVRPTDDQARAAVSTDNLLHLGSDPTGWCER